MFAVFEDRGYRQVNLHIKTVKPLIQLAKVFNRRVFDLDCSLWTLCYIVNKKGLFLIFSRVKIFVKFMRSRL